MTCGKLWRISAFLRAVGAAQRRIGVTLIIWYLMISAKFSDDFMYPRV